MFPLHMRVSCMMVPRTACDLVVGLDSEAALGTTRAWHQLGWIDGTLRFDPLISHRVNMPCMWS